jgi:hypothetical protein
MREWNGLSALSRGVRSAGMTNRGTETPDLGLLSAFSLFRNSVLARLCIVLVIALLLWTAVLWTLS